MAKTASNRKRKRERENSPLPPIPVLTNTDADADADADGPADGPHPDSVAVRSAVRSVKAAVRLDALVDGAPEGTRRVVPWFVTPENEGDLTYRQQVMALQALVEVGTLAGACRAAGVSRREFNKWMENPDFKEAVALALEDVADDLEEVAILRAKAGSDPLMTMMLKAYRPEKFSEKRQVQHTGDPNNPIHMKVDVMGVRELLKQRIAAFSRQVDDDRLSAVVVEADPEEQQRLSA